MNKQEFESIPNHLPIDWEAEQKKCIESPYYFFTNYCTVNGEKCTTPLSEEEFNKEALSPNNGKTFYHNPTHAEIDEAIKLTKGLAKPIASMVMYSEPIYPPTEKEAMEAHEEVVKLVDKIKSGEEFSAPPSLQALESTIDDFISFKFFLNKYKNKLEVLQQKIVTYDNTQLLNNKEVGVIDSVEGRYFSISRPSGRVTVEFGKPSDWSFYQTDFVLRATRRNGGVLTIAIQRK
jgi:hypothetical protein